MAIGKVNVSGGNIEAINIDLYDKNRHNFSWVDSIDNKYIYGRKFENLGTGVVYDKYGNLIKEIKVQNNDNNIRFANFSNVGSIEHDYLKKLYIYDKDSNLKHIIANSLNVNNTNTNPLITIDNQYYVFVFPTLYDSSGNAVYRVPGTAPFRGITCINDNNYKLITGQGTHSDYSTMSFILDYSKGVVNIRTVVSDKKDGYCLIGIGNFKGVFK